MVWINTQCQNESPAPGVIGGRVCICEKCATKRGGKKIGNEEQISMTREELIELFEKPSKDTWEGDNVLEGLNIIAEYLPNEVVIMGVEHDILYSVGIDKLINAGITFQDVNKLRRLNWIIEDNEYMACFV